MLGISAASSRPGQRLARLCFGRVQNQESGDASLVSGGQGNGDRDGEVLDLRGRAILDNAEIGLFGGAALSNIGRQTGKAQDGAVRMAIGRPIRQLFQTVGLGGIA